MIEIIHANTDEREMLPLTKKNNKNFNDEGTVLVVDDEEFICHVARIMLEHMGFKVLIARNGCEAVKLFQKYHEDIVAVLLDFAMPEMNGADAFEELRRIKNDVKIILSTGYTDNHSFFKDDEYMAILEKPYQMEDLMDILQHLIYT